jgi:hypothetical protein
VRALVVERRVLSARVYPCARVRGPLHVPRRRVVLRAAPSYRLRVSYPHSVEKGSRAARTSHPLGAWRRQVQRASAAYRLPPPWLDTTPPSPAARVRLAETHPPVGMLAAVAVA